jgi:hypothetical protein
MILEFVGGPLDGEKYPEAGLLPAHSGGQYRRRYLKGLPIMKWEPDDEAVASQ